MSIPFSSPQVWLFASQIAIVFFTLAIAWLAHRTDQLLQTIKPNFNVLLSLPENISRLILVGLCLLMAWLSGLNASQLGGQVNNFWRQVGVGLTAGLLLQLVIYAGTALAIKRVGRHIYSPWLILNIMPRRPVEWFLVALAFWPPVVMEELLFRSLWLGVFGQSVALGLLVIGTSLIFGWMHQAQGKLGAVLAGILNVLLSLLFIWTGQIVVTITAHYTLNMLQVIVAYFQRNTLQEMWPQPIDKTSVR